MTFDKEIEAIAKCTELVKELDDEAKVRVLKYLIERFGIGAPLVHHRGQIESSHNNQQAGTSQTLLNGNDNTEPIEVIPEIPTDEYPTLKDLLIKNYPKTEPEWVLCYAFYSSKYGSDTFKKDDILEKYKENNRLTTSTSANLSNNINSCVKKDWFKSINSSEFVMKPEGNAYAQEVIKGKSTSKEVKPTKRKVNNPQKVEE